jgi:hypothetical protein
MGAALASQLGNMGGMAALAGGSLGIKNPNDMYAAMFKSRTVEDAMVQHFGLMQEYHTRQGRADPYLGRGQRPAPRRRPCQRLHRPVSQSVTASRHY